MMEINYLGAVCFAFLTTCGFAIILQVPAKALPSSGIIGAIGWLVFVYLARATDHSTVYANFTATVIIALLSEIAARLAKQPVNIFVIPGVFPLVPGLGIYQGMAKIVGGNYEYGMSILMRAACDAGAIAIGMMLVTSIFRVLKIRTLIKKKKEIKNKAD